MASAMKALDHSCGLRGAATTFAESQHAGGMQDQEPEGEHGSEKSRAPTRHSVGGDADAGGDEAGAREIGPKQTASWKPLGHESGDQGQDQEVVYAKDHGGSREEVAARSGPPGQHQRRGSNRQRLKDNRADPDIQGMRDCPAAPAGRVRTE